MLTYTTREGTDAARRGDGFRMDRGSNRRLHVASAELSETRAHLLRVVSSGNEIDLVDEAYQTVMLPVAGRTKVRIGRDDHVIPEGKRSHSESPSGSPRSNVVYTGSSVSISSRLRCRLPGMRPSPHRTQNAGSICPASVKKLQAAPGGRRAMVSEGALYSFPNLRRLCNNEKIQWLRRQSDANLRILRKWCVTNALFDNKRVGVQRA